MTKLSDLIADLALPPGEGRFGCRSCGASAWCVDTVGRHASCMACGSTLVLDCETPAKRLTPVEDQVEDQVDEPQP